MRKCIIFFLDWISYAYYEKLNVCYGSMQRHSQINIVRLFSMIDSPGFDIDIDIDLSYYCFTAPSCSTIEGLEKKSSSDYDGYVFHVDNLREMARRRETVNNNAGARTGTASKMTTAPNDNDTDGVSKRPAAPPLKKRLSMVALKGTNNKGGLSSSFRNGGMKKKMAASMRF